MRRFFIALLVTTALAAGPAQALFSLLDLKNSMVEFLLDQLSTEGVFVITAEEVEEPEDGVTSIRGLAIADAEGIWFRAGRLNFSWNAARLLDGEVEFSNLAMQDVEVLRQPVVPPGAEEPEAKAEEDTSPFAWPRSPLTMHIERLALERVRIAEPVLGHEISFDAEGAARDEGDVQAVRLALTRTDGIRGSIDFDYARNFADNTLAVNLRAAEAPGGIVADLGGLPEGSPSEVTLRAEGPPTDWQMTFELALADLISADGKAKISYQGPVRVDAAFSARPGAKLSPEVATVLGKEAQLVARAAEGADGTILIEEGRITSPDLTLTASGQYERNTGAADLAVELKAGGRLAVLLDGVDFGAISFAGNVRGAPGAMTARGDLKLAGLRTAPVDAASAILEIDVGQSGPADAVSTRLAISGKARGLRLDRIAADVIGEADLSVRAQMIGDAVALEAADLKSKVLAMTATGSTDLASGDFDLTFDLTLPEMALIAAAYGVEASGGLGLAGTARRKAGALALEASADLAGFVHPMVEADRLRLDGRVQQAGATTRFDLKGDGTGLRIDRIDAGLVGRAGLAARGSLTGDDLTLDQARLASRLIAVTADGELSLATGGGRFGYAVSIPDLGVVASRYEVALGGAARLNGVATLPTGAEPRLAGDVHVTDLAWQGTRYGDIRLGHDVEISENPAGEIDLTLANGPYAPAQLRTRFAYAEPRLSLDGFDLSALGAHASGDLVVTLDRPLVEGGLSLRVGDFRPLGRLAGTGLSGRADGRLTLTARDGRQNADLTLNAASIATGDLKIASAKLRSGFRDVLGRPAIDLRADLAGVDAGSMVLRTAGMTVRGPLGRLDIGAELAGEALGKPLTAVLAARVNAAGDSIRATVSRLEAMLDKDRFALARALGIRVRGSQLAVNDIDLSLPDDGRLTGKLARHGGPLSGDLTLSAPGLGFLKRLAGVPVSAGSLDAKAVFDTRASRARADVAVEGRGLAFEDVDASGTLGIDATLNWQGSAAQLGAQISGSFGDPIQIDATLPVRASNPLPQLARRGPVAAKILWKGEIGNLWALVPAPGHVLSGATTVDLGVTGDISDPEITGGVEVRDGGYQNLDLGTILTDLVIDTALLPGGDLGLKVTAADGADGTVRTEGRVALDASGLDLKTTIEDAILLRRDDITARIGGEISVSGPANAIGVNGALVVQDAEVRLINANPPSIATLGDVRIKGQPDPEERVRQSPVDLAIDIDAPGRIFVRGRGLDSEWKMALAIRGDAASPVVSGRIEKVRGRLSLIGKAFDLVRGQIDFDGGSEIDPRIDVVLERKTSDLTGRIIVKGTGSDPQLSFTSNPALPEDEVLPHVLFGKSSQALTGSQAIQLGIGLATLMDGGAGTLDVVRGAVGLDALRVEQDAAGNSSVAIGKEVAEGVWVGSKQPLGEGGTSVAVEIDIFEDVSIDAEVERGGGSSVGLQWKKDF